MRKKILYTLIYFILTGTAYYWFVIPSILVSGKKLTELIESFVRFNIPQFFLAVFLIAIPIVLMMVPKFDTSQNDE